MGKEIERKFLVRDDSWRACGTPVVFKQGYLSTEPKRTVRVRLQGERAYLTIKGASVGASRDEYEYEIPRADATEMLERLCEQPTIEKTRTRIAVEGHVWEVDDFSGANAGLVVAEIELSAKDEEFEHPQWLGQEVTGDARYFNSNLVANPFGQW